MALRLLGNGNVFLRGSWSFWYEVGIIFRRAERSLFAQGHVKMISFLSRPWHPSVFHLFKYNFLGTYWSDLSDFCINITTGSRSIIFQTFGHCKIFFGELLAIKKNQFSDFVEGEGYNFESCLYSHFGNANVSALIDGTLFNWRACCDISGQIFFRPVFVKKERKFFETDLTFPVAHCVSQLWSSFSTNEFLGSVCLSLSCNDKVIIDRGWSFRWPKVFCRRVLGENPSFFRGQVLLCRTFLPYPI